MTTTRRHDDGKILKDNIVKRFLQELKTQKNLYEVLLNLVKATKAGEPGAKIYITGGTVRDLAIKICFKGGFSLKDLDLVVEGIMIQRMEELLEELRRKCHHVKGIDYVGKAFAVFRVSIFQFPYDIELALARTERSYGPRHKQFEVFTENISIKDDTSRRDFRINIICLELTYTDKKGLQGSLIDFHGGLNSILSRKIECVGNPKERFEEDPLRMLRAIRFRSKLPGFQIETKTSAAIRELMPKLLHTVSKERIAEEFFKALVGDHEKAIDDLIEYGVLKETFPELELDGPSRIRICKRIKKLKDEKGENIEAFLIFSAVFLEMAMKEMNNKIIRNLALAKMCSRLFSVELVGQLVRRERIPGFKQITRLCRDTMLLMFFDLLENADAVIENIFYKYEDIEDLIILYQANQSAYGKNSIQFSSKLGSYRIPSVDFGRLFKESGVPLGPHLSDIKLRLRQAEIEGEITNQEEAKKLLDRLYLEDTHLIRDHVSKIVRISRKEPERRRIPLDLKEEIRWLLFTRPIRLIQAYHQEAVLFLIFPELEEAENLVEATPHHFVAGFLNDATMALSLLYEEMPNPSPVHILSLLFLDIGKSQTKEIKPDGTVTYYRHETAGAEMVYHICKRLGVDDTITGDVYFIVKNHNALILESGPQRLRKLMRVVDEGLIEDLLLVHKIDQLSKMRIMGGTRIDEGQLNNYFFIQNNIEKWKSEAIEHTEKNERLFKELINGTDLMSDNPLWGMGLPEGMEIGKLKRLVADLAEKGILKTAEEARREVRGHIVLYHLINNCIEYLETIRKQDLLGRILPEIGALVDVSQTSRFHVEDAYTHTLNVIKALPKASTNECILSAVFHDIGKAKTQSFDEQKGDYHFYGHEKESVFLFEKVCERFGWKNEDLDLLKVRWLIDSHMKAQMDWGRNKNPKKTMEKLFFRGKSPGGIPSDYREDLLVLCLADTLGAVCYNKETQDSNIARYHYFKKLMADIERDMEARDKHADFEEQIRQIWNGSSVMRYFDVKGPEIGRLLRLGQDYVQSKLKHEESITEVQVRDYLTSLSRK